MGPQGMLRPMADPGQASSGPTPSPLATDPTSGPAHPCELTSLGSALRGDSGNTALGFLMVRLTVCP